MRNKLQHILMTKVLCYQYLKSLKKCKHSKVVHAFVDTSPKRSERLRSKRGTGIKQDDQASAGMSLDVLAHVASETLKQEPISDQPPVTKKVYILIRNSALCFFKFPIWFLDRHHFVSHSVGNLFSTKTYK